MSTEAPNNTANGTTTELTSHLATHASTVSPYNLSTAFTALSTKPSITEEIAANDLTSGANYFYVVCAVLGFASGLFLFYSFIKAHRAKSWTQLDTLLCALCISEFYILLCSLSSLAHRPKYMHITNLNCAALSFFFNVAYFSGQLLLVLMAFFLTIDQEPPSTGLLQRALDKPAVCVAATTLTSLLSSMLLTGLLDISAQLYNVTACRVDPCQAGYGYGATKLFLGFILPNLLLLALLGAYCLKCWRSNCSFLPRCKAFSVFLAVTLVTFVCRIFYNGMLMKHVGLRGAQRLSLHQEALMSVAEYVMFSGSCATLVLVVLLYEPFRESLRGMSCCQGLGSREANRHIMAPHIEIRDTQDSTTNLEE